jgi:hypothetical protein
LGTNAIFDAASVELRPEIYPSEFERFLRERRGESRDAGRMSRSAAQAIRQPRDRTLSPPVRAVALFINDDGDKGGIVAAIIFGIRPILLDMQKVVGALRVTPDVSANNLFVSKSLFRGEALKQPWTWFSVMLPTGTAMSRIGSNLL